MAVTRRGPEAVVGQQGAVGLYRQLSGKDRRVAEAEVGRVKGQLLAIDERIKPYGARFATAGATADRAELAAAVGPLAAHPLVHLDAGYDYQTCRAVLTERDLLGQIATQRVPLQAGRR